MAFFKCLSLKTVFGEQMIRWPPQVRIEVFLRAKDKSAHIEARIISGLILLSFARLYIRCSNSLSDDTLPLGYFRRSRSWGLWGWGYAFCRGFGFG